MVKTFIPLCVFNGYRNLAEERYLRVVAEYGHNCPPQTCTISDDKIREFEMEAGKRFTGVSKIIYDKDLQPEIVNYVVNAIVYSM